MRQDRSIPDHAQFRYAPPTDEDVLVSLVDSGQPSDPIHIVRLRDVPGGSIRGTVRGPLPEHLVHRHLLYKRSTFTERNAHGELEFVYSRAKRFRER